MFLVAMETNFHFNNQNALIFINVMSTCPVGFTTKTGKYPQNQQQGL